MGAMPNIVNAFEKEWIERMVMNINTSQASVRHLYITIDPSSGKDLNFYALTSMIFINGQCYVCFFYL
jgi:hypothetical protein